MKWIVMNYVVVAHCLSLVVSLCDACGSCMSGPRLSLHYFRGPTASTHLFALLKEISLNNIPSCGYLFFLCFYSASNLKKKSKKLYDSCLFFFFFCWSQMQYYQSWSHPPVCVRWMSVIAYLNTSITWSVQMSVKTHDTRHDEGITSLFIIPCSSEAAFLRCQWENVEMTAACRKRLCDRRSALPSIPSLLFFITSLYNLLELCSLSLLIAPELNKLRHSLKLSSPNLSFFFLLPVLRALQELQMTHFLVSPCGKKI